MRQYLFPAILALALHGLLLGIVLPHRPTRPPRLPGVPVEIAIRQPAPKPVTAAKKITASQPVAKPVKAVPQPPPKEVKKPVAVPLPSKPAISRKKPAAINTATFAAPKKESKIEKQKEEPQHASPAPAAPAAAPAEKPAQAATPADSSRQEKVEESTAASPAPPVRRRLAVPAYQRNRQPEYPPMARRRGYSGAVMLKVLVDAQGRVADLTLEQSSGHRILDQAALKAVRQWLFSPATEDGRPVAMWVSVPITFELQDQ